MPESPAFVAFAIDLLAPLGPVRARAMFGGHGIYCGDLMIGLVDDDEIFLKTDAGTRPAFEAAGCRRWVYQGGGRAVETSYFRPPDEAHDGPDEMARWGRMALEAARRAARDEAARKRKGAPAKSAQGRKPAPVRPRERRRARGGGGSAGSSR